MKRIALISLLAVIAAGGQAQTDFDITTCTKAHLTCKKIAVDGTKVNDTTTYNFVMEYNDGESKDLYVYNLTEDHFMFCSPKKECEVTNLKNYTQEVDFSGATYEADGSKTKWIFTIHYDGYSPTYSVRFSFSQSSSNKAAPKVPETEYRLESLYLEQNDMLYEAKYPYVEKVFDAYLEQLLKNYPSITDLMDYFLN